MPSPIIERFRAAVSSRQFQRAEELWGAYTAECLAQGLGMHSERAQEMRELMEWTRITVICWRAQALHKLRTRVTSAHAAGAYARAGRV